MPIILSTDQNKEVISKLILDAFEKVDTEMECIYGQAKKLIETAKHYGLKDLAEDMQNRL
jgi:hypothetical protein